MNLTYRMSVDGGINDEPGAALPVRVLSRILLWQAPVYLVPATLIVSRGVFTPFNFRCSKDMILKADQSCMNLTNPRFKSQLPWELAFSFARAIQQIVLDALHEFKMGYPTTTSKRRRELNSIRKLLVR